MTTHPLTRLQIACDKLNVARGPEAVCNALRAFDGLNPTDAAEEIEALLGLAPEPLAEQILVEASDAWLEDLSLTMDAAIAAYDAGERDEVVRGGGEEVKVTVVHTAPHLARAAVPSSKGDKAYVCTVIDHGQGDLTATGCSCMDALRHGGGCKHERSAVAAAWTLRGVDGEVWVPCLKTSRKARRTA